MRPRRKSRHERAGPLWATKGPFRTPGEYQSAQHEGTPVSDVPTRPPLVEVLDLTKTFDVSAPWLNRVIERRPRQALHAVDGMSFTIERGQTLALVGESGCGKSTVARLLVGLHTPTRGTVHFDGVDTAPTFAGRDALALRRRLQMIFQDPYASLNPRW